MIVRLTSRCLSLTRCGFTLTEMAIVIGVIGFVLGGIWSAASAVYEKNRINQGFLELKTIFSEVESIYANANFNLTGNPNFTPTLIAADAIPSWAVIDANNAANPWSSATGPQGGVSVWAQAPKIFIVEFFAVPEDACIALLMHATRCNAGDVGCPMNVATAYGTAYVGPDPATGWQNFSATNAKQLCDLNVYPPVPGGANAVQFQYTL